MAAKSKDKKDGKEKGKVKTKNLKLQKVTVGELSENELTKIQGGIARTSKPL
jgi:bacteriocin-like protein